MRQRLLIGIALSVAVAGCGHSTTSKQPGLTAPQSKAAVAGIPSGTPAWLRSRITASAVAFGDPHPERIVVRLNLHEYGRTVDRVWLRGDFTCDSCTTGLSLGRWGGRVVGATYDAQTRHLLSWSLHS